MTETSFKALDLHPKLLQALGEQGYETPTPIQVQAIPTLLDGRDLLGIAQTGTGKTAAFALPTLDELGLADERPKPCFPRALVLTPTRELAAQVGESFVKYGRYMQVTVAVIFGGVGQNPQVQTMKKGVDILVATPGRLLDLMGQGHIKLGEVEIFVLDEADRMLDMGFIHDVRKVLAQLPEDRQSLLFSATMPPDVAGLAGKILHRPVRVEVTPPATTAERVEQRLFLVEKSDKRFLLTEILSDPSIESALVFSRTKHGANRVVRHLEKHDVTAAAIHGNKSQTARERALESFRRGETRVLVATDIAARGIDVKGITHVINFDLPNVAESYVHRIGRTARAGREGVALSFCDSEERAYLRDIEKLIGTELPVVEEHAFRSKQPLVRSQPSKAGKSGKSSKPGQRGGQRGGGKGRSGGGRGRSAASGGGRR